MPVTSDIATDQTSMVKHYELIQKIISSHLSKEKYYIFLFGSRATKNERARSDIDVGVQGKDHVPQAILSIIREELEESIIPYHVEIVDFCYVSEPFKKIALTNIVIWNKPNFDLNLS